jgi:L,D-transpeptidase catalytic domain
VRSVVHQYGRRHDRVCLPAAACAIGLTLATAITLTPPVFARTTLRNPIQSEAARTPSPLLILVSIRKQRLRAYDVSGQVTESRISSGQPGFDTPTGVFSVLEKNEYHESNIYEGAPMPFMQRLTWSGIAMHAGVVPGYRASHGCIRLPASFAKSFFGITKVGARVIVTPDEAEPLPFEHANLFKPLPAETPKSASERTMTDTTKIASNDTGSDALSEMPHFLGVSPALAEAVRDPNAFAPERPRSRAEADRMFTQKATKLQAALKTGEAQKLAASERAKIAVREADEIADKLKSAKQVIDPLRAAIDAADKKLVQARQTFEAFMNGAPEPAVASKRAGKGQESASNGDREAELEDAILDAAIDADSARNDLARREMDFAAVQAASSAAESTRSAALDDVAQSLAQLRSIQADLIETNKQTVRRNKSVSVFISLKTERIYIRLGQEPLLEAPITINDPGRRHGTHVFTAMRYGTDPNTFDWRLVSAHLPANADPDDDDGRSRKKRRDAGLPQTPDTSARMARAALDSIKIPPDILETIAELARPGASLIISDRELNASENGMGTEFVLLTR